jgi:hypothetical protein
VDRSRGAVLVSVVLLLGLSESRVGLKLGQHLIHMFDKDVGLIHQFLLRSRGSAVVALTGQFCILEAHSRVSAVVCEE